MNRKKGLMIMNLVIAIVCAYVCFSPTIFTSGDYSSALDGIVVARAVVFIFGFFSLEKAFRYFLEWQDEK